MFSYGNMDALVRGRPIRLLGKLRWIALDRNAGESTALGKLTEARVFDWST
jgi:hypothetical protein